MPKDDKNIQQDDLFSLFDEFRQRMGDDTKTPEKKKRATKKKSVESAPDVDSLFDKPGTRMKQPDEPASFLADAEPERPLTVSEVTELVRRAIAAGVDRVNVEGEVSNWKRHRSGHCYFSLKDERSVLRCVMFRREAMRLNFEPDNGDKVTAEGRIDVYEQQGSYQLYVESLRPAGLGDLHKRFIELRDRLEKEGLFAPEHKRPLPFLPSTIAVVTSPTGAAIRDILNVLGRRFANLRVYIYPTAVQGEKAGAQIAKAIKNLNKWRDELKIDALIVSRGGGSMEDLWAFNEEVVARAIYDCEIPVISGVGHEIDFTICDFVSDVRAPTPSAAAELVVQNQEELQRRVSNLSSSLTTTMFHRLDILNERIDRLRHHYALRHPAARVREMFQRLDELDERLQIHMKGALESTRRRISGAKDQLRALGPLEVLRRGYSITRRADGSEIISDAKTLTEGEGVEVLFHRGSIEADVKKIKSQKKD